MDTGQISQGLRADYMGQLGDQGVNVGQMMQSGVSFEDILVMIAAANRGMAIAPGMAGADALMQDGEGGETDAQTLLTQMKDMVQGDSLTQFIQGQAVMENDDLKAQLSEVLDFMAKGSKADAAEDVQVTVPEENAAEETETLKTEPVKENTDADKIEVKADVKPEEAEQAKVKTDSEPIPEEKEVKADTEVKTEAKAEVKTEVKTDVKTEVKTEAKTEIKAETTEEKTEPVENTEKTDKTAEVRTDSKVIPRKLDISEGKRPVISHMEKTEEVKADTPVRPERADKSTFEVREVYTDEWLEEDEGIVIYNPEVRQQLENIFKGTDPRLKVSEGVVPRKWSISDMEDIPRVILKTGRPELSDLNEVTEPDTPVKDMTSGQKFVIDLLGSISKKDRKLDSFDLSEDVIKADPMQLAGLLDYISTGVGIPLISDIADREVFRNINTVGSISAERIFDPNEMIRNGEMEIISYTPAAKTEDMSQSGQNGEQSGSGENPFPKEDVDFARLMKGVRENVNPFIRSLRDDDEDDYDLGIKMTEKLTPETMHDVTRRVDISFDRALAELEMNKAEYGTPDQQVAKGVAENLLRGRSEFTVKLRPEGLGEILVKLVSDDAGKTILSMVASSQRTADLLNRDLASLQSQLGNHNVEIENNSVKVSETVMPAEHQSDAAFSQFDQRRRDEGEQENRYRQVRKRLNTDEIKIGSTEFDTDIEVGRTSVDDSALNITI